VERVGLEPWLRLGSGVDLKAAKAVEGRALKASERGEIGRELSEGLSETYVQVVQLIRLPDRKSDQPGLVHSAVSCN